MKMATVTKGDIVWARVSFPHKWWPGLVLTTDSLGVMVSFFNLNQKHPPTYFIECEVIPFGNNYRSIVGLQLQRAVNDSLEMEMFFQLLHSALKLFGQRNILRLKCPCLSPTQMGAGVTGYDLDSLWPSRLLEFVLKVAVSPWVDVLDFFDATRAVAEVHVFRGYCIANQKGNYLKQHNCLSSTQKMTDALQSDILESEDNSQDLSRQLKRNSPNDGLSSCVLVGEDDFESDKYQVDNCCQTQEMGRIHVAIEASDLNLTGESLKDAAKEVFKLNALNVNRINLSSKLSSETSDSQSSLPANTDTELTIGVGRETRTGGKIYPLVLKNETATYRCAKRRRLDQDAGVSSPKLQDVMPCWIDGRLASLQMLKSRFGELVFADYCSMLVKTLCLLSNKEAVSHQPISGSRDMNDLSREFLSTLDLFSPSKMLSSASLFTTSCSTEFAKEYRNGSVVDLNLSLLLWLQANVRNQCLFLNHSHNMSGKFQNDLMSFLLNNFRNYFSNLGPLDNFISDIDKDEETREKFDISECTESWPETIKDCNFNIQIPSQISAIENEHIDNSQTNNIKVNTEVEITRYPPETLSIAVQLSSELACDSGSKSNKGNKEAKTIEVLGARSKERKNEHQSVSSHSEYNSSIKAKQSEELATVKAPTFLLMKFPRNFSLPSKQELVKRFSHFGSVDLSKTKVCSFRGLAHVTFLNRTDAVAAYEYARRKKMFGSNAHVGFWLRPSKHSTVASNSHQSLVSSPKQKIYKLKPCLKHSNQLKSENRKKHLKVRLLLPEDSPGKVKLGAEDRRTIPSVLPLYSTKVDRGETLVSGLEGSKYHPSYQEHKLYQIPVHIWKTPAMFLLNHSWQVVAGEESNDVEAQNQRELKVSEAIFTCPSTVRPNNLSFKFTEQSV